MKSKILLRSLVVLFFTTTLISSCIDKDYDLANISDDMALKNMVLQAPVGTIDATMEQILKKIAVNEVVVSGDSIFLLYLDTLHLAPTNPVSIISPMSSDNFAAETGTHFLLHADVSFNMSPAATRIDSAILVESQIKIDVHSALAADAQFTLLLPAGLELQNPSDGVFTVSPGVTTRYLDVKDNSIIRTENNPNPSIPVDYVLDTPTSEILGAGDVRVDFIFEKLVTEILWGFLGDVVYEEQSNKIKLDFFRYNVPEGSKLYFSNPTVTCRVLNHVGMASTILVNYVKASSNDEFEHVFADFSGSPTYSSSLDAAPEPYQNSVKTEVFNRVNGGTNQLFLINPTYLSYGFTNQPIIVPGDNHFLVRNKHVDVIVEAKLPFDFDEGTFVLTDDTLVMDLTSVETIEEVKKLLVRINYKNGFPSNIAFDVSFLDENHQPISSLDKAFNLKSAPVDAQGYAIGETKDVFYVKFEESDFADVVKVSYISLKSATKPLNDGSKMKFRPTDYINVKADLYAAGDVKF